MSRHLKTTVYSLLTTTVFRAVPSPAVSTRHARGVRYLEPFEAINFYCGIMNSHKKGQKLRKHIIVRRAPRFKGLHQLYTYHFPKTWSAACVANRDLIKTAQKLAHALEHDYSPEGIEWRIRFFHHYFHVVKGGAKPAPGLKPYSRFYQFVYVSIYRDLKSAAQQALVAADHPHTVLSTSRRCLAEPFPAQEVSLAEPSLPTPEDISFVPINPRPLRSRRTFPLNALSSSHPLTLSSPHPLSSFPSELDSDIGSLEPPLRPLVGHSMPA